MDIAKKLNIAREKLGKNKKEMAEAVGATPRSWIGYEKGENIPGGNVFESLAKLGFNTHWFFTDDPDVPMMIDEFYRHQADQQQLYAITGGAGGDQSTKATPTTEAVTDVVDIQGLLNMTAEVLTSKTVYRPALAANIKAFHRSIALEQDNLELQNRVEKLETERLSTEDRLAAIERMMEDHTRLKKENTDLKDKIMAAHLDHNCEDCTYKKTKKTPRPNGLK